MSTICFSKKIEKNVLLVFFLAEIKPPLRKDVKEETGADIYSKYL